MIIIKADYLDTFEEGEHTIEAHFVLPDREDTISATFLVAAEEETTPDPGKDEETKPSTDEEDEVVPNTSKKDSIKIPDTGRLNKGIDFASFGGIVAGSTVLFILSVIAYFVRNKKVLGKKIDFDKK